MASELEALTFDAGDPGRVGRFWAALLHREAVVAEDGGITVPPRDAGEIRLHFQPSDRPKVTPNRMHLDLTSDSARAQADTVARALELGARHIDVGQRPEEGHVVLADPEGNEFCVIEPGNAFTAGCGAVGCVASDGSQAVGHFWSAALAWPLVWDQDEETAIQSPRGGSKISWGGPPVAPKVGKGRLHLDLVHAPDTDLAAEVDRLLALGATPADIGQGDVPWVVLADPDGNEFCLLPRRS